jgi:O-antigen/teichoic acid export membrane protein
MDRHVLHSLLFRLWSIVSGATLIFLIPHTLTTIEQGYYFTFTSLLATQVFFELGLNSVVMQIVGHEMAHLTMTGNGLQGSPVHRNRLFSLINLLHRFYRIISISFFVFAIVGGFFFFRSNQSLPFNDWFWPWMTIAFLTATNLYLSPFLATIEGMGQIAQVARLRLLQSFFGNLLLWTSLTTHLGLKAIAAVPLIATVISTIWLKTKYSWIYSNRKKVFEDEISWRKEIFPFQWRIAVSWLSGYFIFQLFNPFAFRHLGPESAGQIGLALTVFTTIGVLSFSWMNAKIPVMTQLIAHHNRTDLMRVFWNAFSRSTLLNFVTGVAFVTFVYGCNVLEFKIGSRFPAFPTLLVLMAVTVLNHVIFSAAAFMRAHKEEPMLLNSVVTAVLMLVGMYFASKHSLLLMTGVYSGIILFVTLPWTIYLFFIYAKRSDENEIHHPIQISDPLPRA